MKNRFTKLSALLIAGVALLAAGCSGSKTDEKVFDVLHDFSSQIQSIVYVPDYDDLKISINVSYLYHPDDEHGLNVLVMDQPTRIKYRIFPAQYAAWAADNFKDVLQFDVIPLKTRSGDGDDPIPSMTILGVEYDKATVDKTGEITLIVLPVNVASDSFLAAGLKPSYDIGLTDGNGAYIRGWGEDTFTPFGYFAAEAYEYRSSTVLTMGVWDYKDILAYQKRSAFAASLQLKNNGRVEDYYKKGDSFELNNEVASSYNVLYPWEKTYEILPDLWKRTSDGDIRPFVEDEVYQTLPYTALRSDPKGEKPEVTPKGYRVILKDAVPVVSIGGGYPFGLSPDKLKDGMYVLTDDENNPIFIPEIKISFKEFRYYNTSFKEYKLDDKHPFYVPTEKVYAEIEMNPGADEATRKKALNHTVIGIYEVSSALGSFTFTGEVKIVKPS